MTATLVAITTFALVSPAGRAAWWACTDDGRPGYHDDNALRDTAGDRSMLAGSRRAAPPGTEGPDMHPDKVRRDRLHKLTDLPNIGPAMAADLALLGIRRPQQLAGKDPLEMWRALSRKTGVRQDPCVLDVFMSITRFMDGGKAKPWWAFTAERKRRMDARA